MTCWVHESIHFTLPRTWRHPPVAAGQIMSVRRDSSRPEGPYCAAKTKGTLTVVCPLDAGNCQPRTRRAMQLARPR